MYPVSLLYLPLPHSQLAAFTLSVGGCCTSSPQFSKLAQITERISVTRGESYSNHNFTLCMAMSETQTDEAPTMESNFYAAFDEFLSKPAPTLILSDSNVSISKSSSSSKKTISDIKQPYAQRKPLPRNLEPSKSLLEEAFAYSERLADDMRGGDESFEREPSGHIQSAPSLTIDTDPPEENRMKPRRRRSEPHPLASRNRGGVPSKKSIVHKLRGQTDSARPANAFAVPMKKEVDTKKNPIDFDCLVRNFENQTTLNQLRAELEQSRQSLANSEEYIKELSREMVKFKSSGR